MASAALVVSAVPSVSWADPPPMGSACTIEGTAGPDVLNGTSGSDVICGKGGDDTLKGLGGDDLILGGFGGDTIDGGSGDDDVRGGAGDDTLNGASGEDTIYGDNDDDDLLGGNDDDLIVGGLGEDDVRGNNGADRVFGREDADVVYGGDGDDVLRGGSGSDDHFGQVGDDTIYDRDGAGNVDHASCGDGTDVARVDFYDTVNADCERRRNLDREDPVAVDDAAAVDEDDPATTVDVLANDTDADGGPITIDSVTQPANGTVVITNGGDDLTYVPDADYCNDGSPTDDFTYTLAPGGDSATVAMTVNCVADVPVAEDDTETVDEDDPATTFDVLANDDDEGQVIQVTAVTQPTNGTVVITNAGADLTYQPNANYCNDPPGTATDDFSYTITDGDTATVEVTVTCFDDTADAVDDTATVGEDDTATTVDVLANDGDAEGDAFSITDVTQPTNGTVVITNAGADLTYEPDQNYCNDGVTTDDFTYTITDGDTATVEVTVTCVSDPAVAADDDKTVAEDDPATTIDVLANDTEGDTGTMSIASVTQPTNGTVVITNAGADLTYEPNDNYCNDPPSTTPDTFTYTLTPDGDTATVSVTVTCVNDAPVADDESYTGANAAVGNTVLVHNDPTDGAPSEPGPKKSITGDLLAGDVDVDSAGPLTITAETVNSADGGTAVIEADGDFVYTPKAGTSCTDHSDSFDYTVSDGDGGSDTGTVTIETNGCVWYVDNDDPTGNAGTSTAPFDTLAQAETASAANDTIYLYDGDNTTTGYGAGITLKLNQRLLGEVSDLVVGADTLATGVPGNRPTITASGADVVTLAAGNTVQGLELDPSGAGGGIAGGPGDVGGTIADVRIVDAGTAGTQPGLELDSTSGTFNVSDLTVSTSGATGVLTANAGTVSFAATGTISVTTTGAKAVNLNGTNLGTSVFDTVTSSASGAGGASATNTTGTVTFASMNLTTTSGSTPAFALSNAAGVTVTTASATATGGPAVDVVNAPGAFLNFTSVTSTNSTNDGVNLDGLTTGTFSASGGNLSGAAGIAFDLNGGSGTVLYPGNLNDGTGATAEVTGRTGGSVSFGGTVADSNDAGGGITLSGNTGGSTNFTGTTKTLNTGASNAVSMTSSDGHTLSFVGGSLDIDTTSGRGFNADASGTVTVTGSSNTIDSTTGRALSVVTTDIGAADLTFQRISANGGSQGIVLDTTGTAGNLVVTGTGGTCTIADATGCSGGTIAGMTGSDDAGVVPAGTAIVLRNTSAPSFTRIRINGATNYGIRGIGVNGLTLADSVVHGTLGTSDLTANKDGGLRFEELTGTVNVTNVPVSGGYFTNIMVDNTTGALDATFDNVDSLSLDNTGGDDAVQFEGIGTADMDVEYKNSQITDASGDLFQYIGDGTGGGDLDLTGNAFTNNEPTINTGGGGIALVAGAKGAATMDVLSNTMRDSKTNMLTIIKSRDDAAGTNNLVATISNNTIGAAADANSGSLEGDGMEITTFGDGNATFTVTNNQVRQYNSSGIQFVAGGGVAESGQFNLKVSGNTLANPGTTPLITLLQGIRVDSGVDAADTFATCVDFDANSITGSSDAADKDFRLVASQNTTLRQPGYAGGATDGAAFATYAESLIGGGAQGTAAANAPATFSGGGTTCP
ncbi:beta strand repeat-containing protein [Nocardioides bizhenqiangii]|uniref:Ig-like domain-containing protein n=1 Tax=Nocardioides bizhenqiangii TaxID=3095076 RepID=A0ABZ0ZVS6_9ACTN|nr:Ig-like domain-containing protein [Nocardioides sp. HM61]WQQ28215.1 Ig-like domain-containing protein [Nocardioides sp. HM61]